MAAADPFAADYRLAPETLAMALGRALARLGEEDAVSLPLLGLRARRRLIGATAHLPFRSVRSAIGEGARAVRQDFEICMSIPERSLLRVFAGALERLVEDALARLDPAPLAGPFRFNDLVVQRYPKGSFGITAHRDHVRYQGLVAVVTLAGAARFFVCAERSGRGAREVPCPPGDLLLMRAPGFAGRDDRPFHYLSDVTQPRLALGLRHDLRAE
ncbi:MAG: hypothetical protein V3S27_09760 [Kiloniellales bacterium]